MVPGAPNIGDFDNLALSCRKADSRFAQRHRMGDNLSYDLLIDLIRSLQFEDLSLGVIGVECRTIRLCEPHRMCCDRTQHCLQVERRADRLPDLTERL